MSTIPNCRDCGDVPAVSFNQCASCSEWFCPDCGHQCKDPKPLEGGELHRKETGHNYSRTVKSKDWKCLTCPAGSQGGSEG